MTGNFDILPCGYLSFKDSGIVTGCNITLAAWLGYSKEDIEGKSIESIFTLATRIFYNTHFFPLVKLHSKASEIFLSLKAKDGQDLPVLANAERKMDESDYVIHCVFIRVEERKKFEQELLEAKRRAEDASKENKHLAELSKSLEQFALALDKQYQDQLTVNENLVQFSKIVSHDLQEPIRKIRFFNDLILKDPDSALSSRSKSLLLKIERATNRLRRLTVSLQEFVSTDHEKHYSQLDLNAIVERAKSRAISLSSSTDFDMLVEKMPTIEGYPNQLELMFFHLIHNAIQFRNPAMRLTISVRHVVLEHNIFRMSEEKYKYEEYIRIIFEDNGIGFPQEYQHYVFEIFKKLDATTSGLGMGLALVKKIVQNHSGMVRVTSQPQRGTTFEIELPMKVLHLTDERVNLS